MRYALLGMYFLREAVRKLISTRLLVPFVPTTGILSRAKYYSYFPIHVVKFWVSRILIEHKKGSPVLLNLRSTSWNPHTGFRERAGSVASVHIARRKHD